MAESSEQKTWLNDNKVVPMFVPDNLTWFEGDGLETWYRKSKCDEFLADTDSHFEKTKIINFDMINNGKKLDENKIKQYHKTDHEQIKKILFIIKNKSFFQYFRILID